MSEAVISNEVGMEFPVGETELSENRTVGEGGVSPAAGTSSVVRWERFLPNMVVRVLLVEADDSTRQIIAALLRKCSYRVAAVADGLKAWEVLRGRPCDIDIILAEVDLPLISGYALLTLIMEHELCKNIPVIMMSSHDSVSTVYKCMLRGASDFLVKPVRKNELRNLWQHVWRRQTSNNASGIGPPDESISQKKDEATAENSAASDNNSSRCVACINGSKGCTEKGSDAHSFCTKSESANDGDEGAEQILSLSQPVHSKRVSQGHQISQNDNTIGGSVSQQAIDLIGIFDNHFNAAVGSSASNGAKKFDGVPHLDLSLERSHPNGSVNQANGERHWLNHSEASAFSRYMSKSTQLKDDETFYERRGSDQCNSDTQSPTIASQNHVPMAAVQEAGQTEIAVNGYDCVEPAIYCTQTQTDSCRSLRNSNSIDEADNKYCNLENAAMVLPASIHNGTTISHHQSTVICAPSEREKSYSGHEGVSQRSLQREVALTKFRLKRKDRCFEKKVRYESRKKLAEQRPRVKGQFVRHLADDLQTGN